MKETKTPGVSGKNQKGKVWFNVEKYHQQLDEMDKIGSQKLQDKTDLSNQEKQHSTNNFADQIFEALREAATVDVSKIEIKEEDGVVFLEGSVKEAKEARAIESIAKNIRGVKKVVNNILPEEGNLIQQ